MAATRPYSIPAGTYHQYSRDGRCIATNVQVIDRRDGTVRVGRQLFRDDELIICDRGEIEHIHGKWYLW